MRMRSRLVALLGLALLAAAPSAQAVNVLQFTQRNATNNKFTVVDDGAAPGSKIITTNASGTPVFSIPILIGVLDDADVAILAWLRLENLVGGGDGLVSTSAVSPDTNAPGSNIAQTYQGIIRINSAADMSGTNYLTAAITSGLLKGVIGDFAAGYQAAEPTDSIGFTSDVVPANHLLSPRSVSLAFTGLNQAVNVTGPSGSRRFRAFRSNGTGTFSAAEEQLQQVPEPATLLLGGLGVLPLTLVVRRRKETVA